MLFFNGGHWFVFIEVLISISYHSATCRECRKKIRSIPLQMTNKDDSIDGTIETLVKGLNKERREVKGRLTDVGGAGHFGTNNHN